MNLENKWFRGALPALLIHCSIGSVYAWSLFASPLSKQMGQSTQAIQFAFSLAIFFLGMSASFGGKLVEKNVKRSAIVSAVCFCSGLLVTGLAVQYNSLIGVYLGYGVLMGIGLGIGYITPVKTLMLWFGKQKGLATGIAITGFGFASTIASPLITYLIGAVSLPMVFVIMAGIYIIPMTVAQVIIKKPSVAEDKPLVDYFRAGAVIKNPTFIAIWIMLFINISCGLALISVASPMMKEIGLSATIIATVMAVMGLFNGAGRLLFSAGADKLKDRNNIYKVIFVLSISIISLTIWHNSLITVALLVISACYGAGFSNLPSLLSDKFGMSNISKIHGLSLTAWAIAGLVGNQFSVLIKNNTGSYLNVLTFLLVSYIIALVVNITLIKRK